MNTRKIILHLRGGSSIELPNQIDEEVTRILAFYKAKYLPYSCPVHFINPIYQDGTEVHICLAEVSHIELQPQLEIVEAPKIGFSTE